MDFSGKGFDLKISEVLGILNFHLYNFKNNRSKDASSGIGIANVKKRLEILYPKKHTLIISETETDFAVELMINLNK